MPELKPRDGYNKVKSYKFYLEREGREIARDFFNLELGKPVDDDDKNLMIDVDWADQMDDTRSMYKHDRMRNGKPPRFWLEYVLSPDPKDNISLEQMRSLACDFVAAEFSEYQVAIIYHDDNEKEIMHAHIIVNCSNLVTGKKLHEKDPKRLNRKIQKMAQERGLTPLSNEDRVYKDKTSTQQPKTRQAYYESQEERKIKESGRRSWVSDIRDCVSLAARVANNESEFREILKGMNINVNDNSTKAWSRDWIYSFTDQPSKKVSGERLGMLFTKKQIENKFSRSKRVSLEEMSDKEFKKVFDEAIEIENTEELFTFANAMSVCERYNIKAMEDFDKRLGSKFTQSEQKQKELQDAKEYMRYKNLLPEKRQDIRQASNNNTNRKFNSYKRRQEEEQEVQRRKTQRKEERGKRRWR